MTTAELALPFVSCVRSRFSREGLATGESEGAPIPRLHEGHARQREFLISRPRSGEGCVRLTSQRGARNSESSSRTRSGLTLFSPQSDCSPPAGLVCYSNPPSQTFTEGGVNTGRASPQCLSEYFCSFALMPNGVRLAEGKFPKRRKISQM